MQKKTRNRFFTVLLSLSIISIGISFILNSLSDDILFYYPPSEIPNSKYNKIIRVGGLVKENTINKTDIRATRFVLTDNKSEITILFHGTLPTLFREKQGIVAKGVYDGKIFNAESLLAKHDETYRPK